MSTVGRSLPTVSNGIQIVQRGISSFLENHEAALGFMGHGYGMRGAMKEVSRLDYFFGIIQSTNYIFYIIKCLEVGHLGGSHFVFKIM